MVKVNCPGGKLKSSNFINGNLVQQFEEPSVKTFAQCREDCGEDHIYCGAFGKSYIPYFNAKNDRKRMKKLATCTKIQTTCPYCSRKQEEFDITELTVVRCMYCGEKFRVSVKGESFKY